MSLEFFMVNWSDFPKWFRFEPWSTNSKPLSTKSQRPCEPIDNPFLSQNLGIFQTGFRKHPEKEDIGDRLCVIDHQNNVTFQKQAQSLSILSTFPW